MFSVNANKRGITLNLETFRWKRNIEELIKKADCVLESFRPNYINEIGLGYSELQKINLGLIMTSITHFGKTGPYSNFKTSDLVAMSIRADGTAATMIAYYYREVSGKGQHIDISIQLSVSINVTQAAPLKELHDYISRRAGVYRPGILTAELSRLVWPCKDGFVNFGFYKGSLGAKTNRAIVEWMDKEGLAEKSLKEMDWENFGLGKLTREELQGYEEKILRFFINHKKKELYEGATKRGIILYPVNTIGDLINDLQLKDRGFWIRVFHPELGEEVIYPGSFVRTSEKSPTINRRALLIGEHNIEIYEGELGFSRKEMLILKEAGVI